MDKFIKCLIEGILKVGKDNGYAVCGGYISGMFGFFFIEGLVKNFVDVVKSDIEKFGCWYCVMFEEGVYLVLF